MRWERQLERWVEADLITPAAAQAIRRFEASHEHASRLRWPVLLAIALGGLLLGAGVLLFVAANWDQLSPAARFTLVLALVAAFHGAGAVSAARFAPLGMALHALGTVCLGAGIFLAAQIFNLREHWPGGLMLWALGAAVAWGLLRHWSQALLLALLAPAWLAGEWVEATQGWSGAARVLNEATLLLMITYLTAVLPGRESAARKALYWIGGGYVIPAAAGVAFSGLGAAEIDAASRPLVAATGWAAAIGLPLLLAAWLRGRAAWMNAVAAAWVVLLGLTGLAGLAARELATYALCALGALGLTAWGLAERSRGRINLGIAGFAITVLAFYFSTVMDKLGRSASLIGLGLLFIGGGWLLERARRRLVARVTGETP